MKLGPVPVLLRKLSKINKWSLSVNCSGFEYDRRIWNVWFTVECGRSNERTKWTVDIHHL